MATIKIYRLKNAFRSVIPVKIEGGELRYIRFSGGSRSTRTCGFYSTKNIVLQKALENGPLYGTEYVLESSLEATSEKEVEFVPLPSAESCLRDPETATRDTSVTSKKMAIAFVQAEFGGTFPTDVRTVEEHKIYAAKTWNVLFEKWE